MICPKCGFNHYVCKPDGTCVICGTRWVPEDKAKGMIPGDSDFTTIIVDEVAFNAFFDELEGDMKECTL